MSGKAAAGSGGRTGSAEKSHAVPHTRIEDAKHIASIYTEGHKLGEGSFGIVTKVTHNETGKVWACKTVNKERAGSMAIKLLEREVAILKRVEHDHIIKLKEVFETPKKMYLIMEYCGGGELRDVLRERIAFSEAEAKVLLQRLASAIRYLHRNDMVHRDLKLENILLGTNPQDASDKLYIKVTDFGLSVVKGGVGHENMLQDFCGTPLYMAPEIIENKTYGHLCDVWAMGVITYMLMSGTAPFQSSQEEKLYEIIKNADIAETLQSHVDWKHISEQAKDCMAGMLTVDPAHRYSASEVQDHSWLTGAQQEEKPRNVLELMKMVHAEERQNNADIASTQQQVNSKPCEVASTKETHPATNNNNNVHKPAAATRKKHSDGAIVPNSVRARPTKPRSSPSDASSRGPQPARSQPHQYHAARTTATTHHHDNNKSSQPTTSSSSNIRKKPTR